MKWTGSVFKNREVDSIKEAFYNDVLWVETVSVV